MIDFARLALVAVVQHWAGDVEDLQFTVLAPDRLVSRTTFVRVLQHVGDRKIGVNIAFGHEVLARGDQLYLQRIVEDASRKWREGIDRAVHPDKST